MKYLRKTLTNKILRTISLALSFSSSICLAHPVEKPGPGNTGPLSSENELTPYSGPNTISQDNTIIEGVLISNTLRINADNVVIRDFILDTDNHFGIQIYSSARNTQIEDGELRGMIDAAIIGSNFTAKRLEIHNTGKDGVKGRDNFVLENSWIYDLGYVEGAHADGVQVSKGSGGIIRENFFDMPKSAPGYANSQCILLRPDTGTIDNMVIRGNWINGGGISLQVRGGPYGIPTNTAVLENRFGSEYQHKPISVEGNPFTAFNIWDTTGEPLTTD